MVAHSKMAKLFRRALPVPVAAHDGQSSKRDESTSHVEPMVAHASPVVAMVATPQKSGNARARLAAMWKRKPVSSDAAEETLESSECVTCFFFQLDLPNILMVDDLLDGWV